ncbi:MAG: tripartite tricarboxylate transporter substrate-binding protein [Gammaproteobacteria bacterium]|nr:tripartite tricarboxylate transporter substrate-binding protein [Gammaproteobacteria bacterium]
MKPLNRLFGVAFYMLLTNVFVACAADNKTSVIFETDPDIIEFLTAFGEAGSSSKTASIIAPKLEEYLGSPIVLKFSQGRFAGVESPAGKTIVTSTIGLMALLPGVVPGYPLDPLDDLRPITRTTETPDILVVRSGLGINTIEELIAYTKVNPNALNYFHVSSTSIHRLEFAALFGELGVLATLDTARSNGNEDAMEGIRDGTLDLMASTSPYMMQLISSGAAIPLVVIHPTRMPLFPAVPTLLELGATTMSLGSWAGVFAPKETSDEDLDFLLKAVEFAMADPEIISAISALGMEVSLSESSAGFSRFIDAETQRLRSAAETYDFRPELN